MGSYKRKRVVLEEFTKILHDHNPMGLPLRDMPDGGADEYESEALSILSRFNESAIQLCDDGGLQREIAVGLVRQCFEFWFSGMVVHEIEKLGFALLEAYQSSYPQPEQQAEPTVPSEP